MLQLLEEFRKVFKRSHVCSAASFHRLEMDAGEQCHEWLQTDERLKKDRLGLSEAVKCGHATSADLGERGGQRHRGAASRLVLEKVDEAMRKT